MSSEQTQCPMVGAGEDAASRCGSVPIGHNEQEIRWANAGFMSVRVLVSCNRGAMRKVRLACRTDL